MLHQCSLPTGSKCSKWERSSTLRVSSLLRCQHQRPSRVHEAESLCNAAVRPSTYAAVCNRRNRRSMPAATLQAESPTQALVASWVAEQKAKRLDFLEEEAMDALTKSVRHFQHPVFPCALIAGDVAILHMLHRLGYLAPGKVLVTFIDTLHLFPQTYAFLSQLQELWGFEARVYKPLGFETKEEYQMIHGSDLFIRDVDQYDAVCKIEPFQRAMRDLECDLMINGRRRDHGAERAAIELFEEKVVVNCNALAYWTFRDVFDYLAKHKVPYHPLHDQGYPSVGDEHSTLPVPRERWFDYAGERAGRFQGLKNSDGTTKTECGIHSSPLRFVK